MSNQTKMHVVNMRSNRGNDVPNQFIITTEAGRFFQSYKSVIAFIPANSGKVQLDRTYWDYSKTTGKYRNEFLGESKSETAAKIAAGVYELTNLN